MALRQSLNAEFSGASIRYGRNKSKLNKGSIKLLKYKFYHI